MKSLSCCQARGLSRPPSGLHAKNGKASSVFHRPFSAQEQDTGRKWNKMGAHFKSGIDSVSYDFNGSRRSQWITEKMRGISL